MHFTFGRGAISSVIGTVRRLNICESSSAAFMFGKAILFGDKESASKILINQQPSAAKAVGRAVRGFDETAWDCIKSDIMFDVVLAKFSQNEDLNTYLQELGTLELVEASPFDTVWGI